MRTLAVLTMSMLLPMQEKPEHLVRDLIEKLRSDRIEERETASRSLIALGSIVFPQLEEAARSNDVEVGSRARAVIAAVKARLAWETFLKIEDSFNRPATLSLRFVYESSHSDEPEVSMGAGMLMLKSGNKLRMSYKPERSKWGSLAFVSDGSTLAYPNSDLFIRKPPPTLNATLGRIFVRRGYGEVLRVLSLYTQGEIQEEAFATSSRLANLRRGPDDGTAKTLMYDAQEYTGEQSKIKLWYDAKTYLIMKRTTETALETGRTRRLFEVYDDLKVDGDLPEERFTIARK